jgi:predicted nucleic acid-binding protein
MSDDGRMLVDTSAWIDYFAGVEPLVRALDRPMDERRIVVCGQIKQEMLQGARDQKMFARLEREMSMWTYEAETPDDFIEAARQYARLRWKGVTVPPSDCLIAAVAKRCGLRLCATDPDFAKIPGLRLVAL